MYLSNKAKQENADSSSSTLVSHLTPQQHATVVGLVGKRCTVKGEINGQKVDVLWDTGAQVSLISGNSTIKKRTHKIHFSYTTHSNFKVFLKIQKLEVVDDIPKEPLNG